MSVLQTSRGWLDGCAITSIQIHETNPEEVFICEEVCMNIRLDLLNKLLMNGKDNY